MAIEVLDEIQSIKSLCESHACPAPLLLERLIADQGLLLLRVGDGSEPDKLNVCSIHLPVSHYSKTSSKYEYFKADVHPIRAEFVVVHKQGVQKMLDHSLGKVKSYILEMDALVNKYHENAGAEVTKDTVTFLEDFLKEVRFLCETISEKLIGELADNISVFLKAEKTSANHVECKKLTTGLKNLKVSLQQAVNLDFFLADNRTFYWLASKKTKAIYKPPLNMPYSLCSPRKMQHGSDTKSIVTFYDESVRDFFANRENTSDWVTKAKIFCGDSAILQNGNLTEYLNLNGKLEWYVGSLKGRPLRLDQSIFTSEDRRLNAQAIKLALEKVDKQFPNASVNQDDPIFCLFWLYIKHVKLSGKLYKPELKRDLKKFEFGYMVDYLVPVFSKNYKKTSDENKHNYPKFQKSIEEFFYVYDQYHKKAQDSAVSNVQPEKNNPMEILAGIGLPESTARSLAPLLSKSFTFNALILQELHSFGYY